METKIVNVLSLLKNKTELKWLLSTITIILPLGGAVAKRFKV